jgi:hypothetical protein
MTWLLLLPVALAAQARFPVRSLEHIFLFDPDHRQPERRSAFRASRCLVSCFSLASRSLRAAVYSSRDATRGRFA